MQPAGTGLRPSFGDSDLTRERVLVSPNPDRDPRNPRLNVLNRRLPGSRQHVPASNRGFPASRRCFPALDRCVPTSVPGEGPWNWGMTGRKPRRSGRNVRFDVGKPGRGSVNPGSRASLVGPEGGDLPGSPELEAALGRLEGGKPCGYTHTGNAFSGSTPRSLIARATAGRSTFPCWLRA